CLPEETEEMLCVLRVSAIAHRMTRINVPVLCLAELTAFQPEAMRLRQVVHAPVDGLFGLVEPLQEIETDEREVQFPRDCRVCKDRLRLRGKAEGFSIEVIVERLD